MIIIAGHILVAPARRDAYLDGCEEVVAMARKAAGCLDYALGADLVSAGRVNVFERWESAEALAAFRGSGPSEEQRSQILSAAVVEYAVSDSREVA
jgi:quinol monooxygenase YgiN